MLSNCYSGGAVPDTGCCSCAAMEAAVSVSLCDHGEQKIGGTVASMTCASNEAVEKI